MSETKQTRCPFCSSVFNITDEQLAARGGHVRCGGCLQVFRADQHIVTGEAITSTPSSPPVSTTSLPVVARSQSSTMSTTTEAPSKPAKKRKNPDDESWAMNLLGDELDDELQEDNPDIKAPTAKIVVEAPKPVPVATKKPLFDDEISDMLHDSWLEPTASKDHLKSVGEVDKIKASADESWAQALMSELEADEKKEQAKNHSMDLIPTKAKEPPRKSTNADKKAEAPPQKAPAKSKEDDVKPSKEDDLLNFLNSNSAPTINQRQANLPLEIKHAPMISIRWGYWITWTMLCGLALVLLTVQYVYFNFESLSLNEKTRPQILQLCSSLNCRVPEPPNIELIVINKLTVRNHPDIKGALRVNAIVYNKASFAQPLPALKLSFMNRKHKPTASRAFQPKEYLQGDATHLRRIPPETPIHIQLDIANPDVEMAGYAMKPLFK